MQSAPRRGEIGTHASGVLGLRPLVCGKALPFRQSD